MIEIVFSESAAGGLKVAQGFGKGKYPGGCTAVFLRYADGSPATQAEIKAKQREIEEQQRREWEAAMPIGGSPRDVCCFDLALSYGDISEDGFLEKRASALKELCGHWPEEAFAEVERRIASVPQQLEELLERAKDETVRIWTSDQPDEACGLHWIAAQLLGRCSEVQLVTLPRAEMQEGVLRSYHGWGEVSPGEWGRLLKYESPIADVQLRAYAARWRELQAKNMPLRATLNGDLRSMPEDGYDHFIRWEIEREEEKFRQARVIGNVLGRHQPGVGDGFIALRMEKMLRSGELEIVQEAGEGEPSYRRILKKTQCH